MIILAILYNSHDNSVAMIKDGVILFACSNERFSRIKMDRGLPIQAIRECLHYTKIPTSKIDQVVFVGEPFPKSFIEVFRFFTMPVFLTRGRYWLWLKNPVLILKSLIYTSVLPAFLYREIYSPLRIRWELRGFKKRYVFVPHHLSHLYSAYFTSGWKDCLVGCFEGSGLIKAVSLYDVKQGRWTKITENSLPNSAGFFYTLSTYILGFKPVRHEGKITGLAAYGNPQKASKLVESLISVKGLKIRVNYNLWQKIAVFCQLNKRPPPYLQKYSREDIAAAFQQRLEDCVLAIINLALLKYPADKIAMAGGVMANVKLNQKIHDIGSVKHLFIHPAMGDDGIALGAALYQAHQSGFKLGKLNDVYFGPAYTDQTILKALKKYQLSYRKVLNIEKEMAKLLAQGHIIARFNGRMEYGPRALGNRSILCQATDVKINQILNQKLKRTEFMPFAPVVLKRLAPKCFKNLRGAEYSAKFMTITFECTDYMKRRCPAVVHVDGTARPQILSKSDNPSYYKILNEYYKITKIPALINTSFNLHEEPIVCTPDDAIRAVLAGELDYLAIGNYLVVRTQAAKN